MTSTRTILRSPVPRAVAVAVAAVATAGLLLGLLAGALGGSGSAAPAAAPAAAVPAPAAPVIPAPSTPSAETPRLAARHVVAAGETLAGIAQRYGVPTELLAADNALRDPDRVACGTTLGISTPPSDVVVVHAGDTLGELAASRGTTVEDLMVLNPQVADPDRIAAGDGLRVAVSG